MHELSNDPYPTPSETAFDPEFLTAPNGGIGDAYQEDYPILDESQSPDTSVIGIPEERGRDEAETIKDEAPASPRTLAPARESNLDIPQERSEDPDELPEPQVQDIDVMRRLGVLPTKDNLAAVPAPNSETEIIDSPESEPAESPEPPVPQAEETPKELLDKVHPDTVALPDNPPTPQNQEQSSVSPEFPAIHLSKESDVDSRLPQFQEIVAAIGELAEQGALQGIPEGVQRYLGRMEAIGVDSQGQVVMPEGYKPEEILPVLTLRPDEERTTYTIPGLAAEADTVAELINISAVADNPEIVNEAGTPWPQTAEELGIRVEDLEEQVRSLGAAAHIFMTDLLITPNIPTAKPFRLLLPKLMVASGVPEYRVELGRTAVHEADHWDFLLNVAPTLRNHNGEPYSDIELKCIAEKRAYRTDFIIDRNHGHYEHVGSLEKLTAPFKGLAPTYAQWLELALHTRLHVSGVPKAAIYPLVVKAITSIFGDPDRLITEEEIIAFQSIGVLGGK